MDRLRAVTSPLTISVLSVDEILTLGRLYAEGRASEEVRILFVRDAIRRRLITVAVRERDMKAIHLRQNNETRRRRVAAKRAKKLAGSAVALLLTLLVASSASAQTTALTTLSWDVQGKTLVDVASYVTTVTVNGAAVTGTPTCVQKGADVNCTVPVPNLMPNANSVEIVNTKGEQAARTVITGLSGTGGVANASRPRLNVTVTINVQ